MSGAAYVFTELGTVANEPGRDDTAFTLTAFPNPARAAATLRLTLGRPQPVTVAVYDGLGREVAVLHDGDLTAGSHALALGASGLPAGIYLVRATVGQSIRALRVTLLD